MYRRARFGRSPGGWTGFTRQRRVEVQFYLGVLLPHVVPEIHVLLTSPSRSGLRSPFPARPICCSAFRPWSASLAWGPAGGRGKAEKELVSGQAVLHPETERRATEVGRCGSGVLLERRSLAWLQVPCAEQWLTVGQAN